MCMCNNYPLSVLIISVRSFDELLIKPCLSSIGTTVVYIVKLLVNLLDSIALLLAMSLEQI